MNYSFRIGTNNFQTNSQKAQKKGPLTLLLGPVHFKPTGPTEDQTQKLSWNTAKSAFSCKVDGRDFKAAGFLAPCPRLMRTLGTTQY